jgi:hypothetical protein
MATITFLSSGKFQLSASVGSASIQIEAWGAGGSGNSTGNGGSGGGSAVYTAVLTNRTYDVIVGTPATLSNGGSSYVTSSLGTIIVRAAGGQVDGTVSEQTALQTGSSTYLGGLGGTNNNGYSAYDGSGGGSSATTSSNGVDGKNESGQLVDSQLLSSFYYRNDAIGGAPGTASGAGAGGAGAYYNFNGPLGVQAAESGSVPGGGGGGAYDYGTDSSGAGGNGKVVITGVFA